MTSSPVANVFNLKQSFTPPHHHLHQQGQHDSNSHSNNSPSALFLKYSDQLDSDSQLEMIRDIHNFESALKHFNTVEYKKRRKLSILFFSFLLGFTLFGFILVIQSQQIVTLNRRLNLTSSSSTSSSHSTGQDATSVAVKYINALANKAVKRMEWIWCGFLLNGVCLFLFYHSGFLKKIHIDYSYESKLNRALLDYNLEFNKEKIKFNPHKIPQRFIDQYNQFKL